MSSDIAIRVENLGKSYQIYDKPHERLLQSLWRGRKQYFREFWALRNLSFEVRRGESVAVIGRNGSGKSTLLQMIAGTLSPTTGHIETHGRIAALLELGSGFNADFTGRENIFLNGALLGLSERQINERFDAIAAFADIGDFIEQPVKTYSSGMVVRLAFAVSVCVEPEVLIVDEALAVGDAAFQFKCLDRLKTLTSNGTTLLFVSHDMGMVKSFCSYGIYLANGIERARGAPDELAELYFMDIRAEQRGNSKDAMRVYAKPFIGTGSGIAFGTDEGQVVAATFVNTGTHFSSFMSGESVMVEIEVLYKASISNPFLSLIVEDQRKIALGGHYFSLTGRADSDGMRRANITVKFAARFSAGRYYITVRLENRPAPATVQPIEKQAGMLSMEIMQIAGEFIGPVNLDLAFSESDAEGI